MKKKVHLVAALLSFATLAQYFVSVVLVEGFGNYAAIILMRHYLAFGLLILIPALLIAAVTGMSLATGRSSPLLRGKMNRMTTATALVILVLAPATLYLSMKAGSGAFDRSFVLVQLAELFVIGACLLLLGRNIRDGLKLSGRAAARPPARKSG